MLDEKEPEVEHNPELRALHELERVVDFTRRARMEASDRLIASERFIQNINIYYSCFAVILSILCLLDNNPILNIISALLTSILAISIVFLNAQHYGDRAQQFHDNFLELYQLLFDVRAAIRSGEYTHTHDLEVRYIELLKSIENHTQQDFLQILSLKDRAKARRDKSYKKQFTGLPKVCFIAKRIIMCVLKALIWLLPIFCVLFAMYAKYYVVGGIDS